MSYMHFFYFTLLLYTNYNKYCNNIALFYINFFSLFMFSDLILSESIGYKFDINGVLK